MTTSKPVFEIDGARISSLEDFYDEMSAKLIPGANWGRNLDSLNDILRGGFGTPDEGGFVVRWTHSDSSRESLGHAETLVWLEKKLGQCHPSAREKVREEIEAARRRRGADSL